MKRSNKRWWVQALGVGMLCVAGGMAHAQNAGADIQSRYQQEVERCRGGLSGQALETCMKEAGAAKAEAQRNRLAPASSVDYEQNQLQRCNVFKDEAERRSCVERTRQTPTKGTIEGGGVLREHIETVPGNPVVPR